MYELATTPRSGFMGPEYLVVPEELKHKGWYGTKKARPRNVCKTGQRWDEISGGI